MNMNRRTFLKSTVSGLFVAASPKIIFDYGANSWRKLEPYNGEIRCRRSSNMNFTSIEVYYATEKRWVQIALYSVPNFKGIITNLSI